MFWTDLDETPRTKVVSDYVYYVCVKLHGHWISKTCFIVVFVEAGLEVSYFSWNCLLFWVLYLVTLMTELNKGANINNAHLCV